MTTVAPPKIYLAPDSGALVINRLDSLCAVYDRRSGITHLVAEPVPSILEALAGGGGDLATIMARLNERFDVEGGQDVLAARLDELVALGLVAAAGG